MKVFNVGDVTLILYIMMSYREINIASVKILNHRVDVALHKKLRFPLRSSSVNATIGHIVNADLVTFIKEILNGKLNFLCSVGIPTGERPGILVAICCFLFLRKECNS